jgi:beta-glucuronidase
LGSHEGGFTPFQFELTADLKEGENSIIVRCNNARIKDGIPGYGFDWFNYGGITRDVNLIETSQTFIEEYFIKLNKNNPGIIEGYIQLNGHSKEQNITIDIPEAKLKFQGRTSAEGKLNFQIKGKVQLWSPENPRRYLLKIITETDQISEEIGFRTIEVKGTEILLNEKVIFLKGVNIHEEIPQRKARAYSESDAQILLGWAKELGCNFVRLAHYPHSEHTIKLAEKMGLLIWEEIPVYQHINFADAGMRAKMDFMLREMIHRDKNRCAVIIWSLSNETYTSKDRDEALRELISKARALDNTRLITCAFNNFHYKENKIVITDELYSLTDIVSINEYLGWYKTWPAEPEKMQCESKFNKPLIISEFGGEAMFGNEYGKADIASTWSEEYQEKIFIDQIKMFKNIPFLSGVCPWILVDFRSPVRMHPQFQDGWNRKGLLSDRGEKKKAWYVMRDYYLSLSSK